MTLNSQTQGSSSSGLTGRSKAMKSSGPDAPVESGHDGVVGWCRRTVVGAVAALVAGAIMAQPATAQEEEQVLVDRAKATVERIRRDPDYKKINELLLRSHGALIVPELIKAGFILGGEGGTGVMLRRDADTGRWGYPAFYDLGAGSIGLQVGVSASEVIFLFMTKEGLELAMSDKMKFGADAGIAVAWPVDPLFRSQPAHERWSPLRSRAPPLASAVLIARTIILRL